MCFNIDNRYVLEDQSAPGISDWRVLARRNDNASSWELSGNTFMEMLLDGWFSEKRPVVGFMFFTSEFD